MGDTYNGVGHSEEALAVFAQAFDLAEKDLNVPGQGRAQLGMAAASADLGRHSHALSMFSKARRVFENTGDAICMARACKGQGDMYAALGFLLLWFLGCLVGSPWVSLGFLLLS